MSDLAGVDLSEGVRMLQAGQLAASADFFTHVVQRDTSNGPAFGYLGIALTRLGQSAEALNALGQASQLQPQDPAAQYNVAIGLMHAGRSQDAVAFLEYTLTLDPGHAQARAALDSIRNAPPVEAPPSQWPGAADPSAAGSAPSGYSQPAQPVGVGQPAYSAPLQPASMPPQGGMHYTPNTRQVVQVRPDAGTRLLRGLGWGAAYGQYWTLWNMFLLLVWNLNHLTFVVFIVFFFGYCAACTVSGVIAGLIIASLPPSIKTGATVGVVFGLILCGIQMLVFNQPQMFINIFFWFFTGRYVGSNIAVKVHRPVQQ